MIAVIADDITGAAEMAGIAHRLGLRVRLTTDTRHPDECDVLVVATDTRSMTREEAVAESKRVAEALSSLPGVTKLFKKTDSALRGHVIAELAAILGASPYTDALYLPANPSKGRTISDGVYYIGDTPLHLTDFSFDPEFPALTSSLAERFPDAGANGVRWAEATSAEDIDAAVVSAPDTTLLAGAADLFTSFLKHHCQVSPRQQAPVSIDRESTLIVCGSTQSKPIDCGAPTAYMPTPVYEGGAADAWFDELAEMFLAHGSLIIAMRDRHLTGRDTAMRLRATMAGAVSHLLGLRQPNELIIEGGATAFAILSRLGQSSFTVTDEIAPGVIRMLSPSGFHVTMKPGSYPWGSLF